MPRHLATATDEEGGPVSRLDGRAQAAEGHPLPAPTGRRLGLTRRSRGRALARQAQAQASIWTAHELSPLLATGWHLVSHVTLERTDLDHALAGPGGFYAIETAYRPHWESAVDDLATMAAKARRAAHGLQMRMELGRRTAGAVLVMWGPGAEQMAESRPEVDGAVLVAGTRLAAWTRTHPLSAGSVVVDQAVRRLHEYVARHDEAERAELARLL